MWIDLIIYMGVHERSTQITCLYLHKIKILPETGPLKQATQCLYFQNKFIIEIGQNPKNTDAILQPLNCAFVWKRRHASQNLIYPSEIPTHWLLYYVLI